MRSISEKKLAKLGGRKPFTTFTKQRKALPKANARREKKRRDEYRKKMAAYKRTETYNVVEARAGGRCEAKVHLTAAEVRRVSNGYETEAMTFRCPIRRRDPKDMAPQIAAGKLEHHHKTYARFGGDELPEDMEVLCARHHAEAEAKHPTRKAWARRQGGAS